MRAGSKVGMKAERTNRGPAQECLNVRGGFMGRRLVFVMMLVTCMCLWTGQRADAISLLPDDVLTLSGYLRTEADFHTGPGNPNNADIQKGYNHWNLQRNTLMTDLNYKPSENFKIFAKFRIEGDLTDEVDNHVVKYNAYPGYKGSGSGFRTALRGDNGIAELRDVYADISVGNLWVRAGKQQIVWGESDGFRLLDVFNPLDLTQRLFLYNQLWEQFGDIRIPVWALRATYAIPNRKIDGLAIEGVFNPGDTVPTMMAAHGAPYNLVPSVPRFVTVREEDRRGDMSGGGRVLGKIGNIAFTLNYLYTYNQDGILRNKGIFRDPTKGIPLLAGFGDFTPYSVLVRNEHPKVNIFGASFNSAPDWFGGVIRGEFTYVPDQPYEGRPSADGVSHEIVRRGTFQYVLGLEKSLAILPISVTPSMTSFGFQFFQTIREGEPRDLAINQAKVDKVDNKLGMTISQSFSNDRFIATFFGAYDLKGCYWWQPAVKYKPGMHWIFDIVGNWLGGKDDRAYKLGGLDFASGVTGRITYQF